ncbi:MAG: GDSL-type esterase/lipase family protein [Homoserinimonas sp.]
MATEDSAEPHSIAFVGDSLVREGDWANRLGGDTVQNFGVSGDTTDDVLARLGSIIETRPDEVLLLIGTNDLGTRHTVEHLVRNIESMLIELRRELPESRVLVHSILPRGREFAHSIKDANIHLRQFSATVHAQYLDLWPALAQGDGSIDPRFSDDRLHLNDEGYDAWLAELLPALERLRERPPMTSPIIAIRRDDYSRPA